MPDKLLYKFASLSMSIFMLLLLSGLPVQAEQRQAIFNNSGFLYTLDTPRTLNPQSALQLFRAPGTQSKTIHQIHQLQKDFDVGNVDQVYWFYARLTHTAQDQKKLYLLAELPYRQLLNAYIANTSGEITQILEERVYSPFAEAGKNDEWQHRWQISSSFIVDNAEPIEVLVQYHAMGGSYLPLEILDHWQLMQRIYEDSISAALFYSFSLAAILLFFFFGAAVKDKASMLYAALFLLALLMLAAMEGFAFKYLWPDMPRWNHFSSLVLIYLFCALGFFIAAKAEEPATQQCVLPNILQRILLVLSAGSVLLAVSVTYLPFILLVKGAVWFVAAMFMAQGVMAFYWTRTKNAAVHGRNLIAIVSAVLIAVLVILLALKPVYNQIFPEIIYVNANRLVFLLAGLATMATIISHVSGLRQDYAVSLERELAATQREVEINRELFEAEQKYSRLRNIAALRNQQLAEVSHDLRQPLVSLNSTIDTIMQNQPEKLRQQLRNAFDYLQNLCTSYVDIAHKDNDFIKDDGNGHESTFTEQVEPYPINLVQQTVLRMFQQDAQQKNMQLRIVPSSVYISPTPTIVIRVISNLVANAIAHAANDIDRPVKILLGVRRYTGHIKLCVIDNGVGINPAIIDSVTESYEKGPDSSGTGLGLAICQQQAEQHGMQLEILSWHGKGSCFQLRIPISAHVTGVSRT